MHKIAFELKRAHQSCLAMQRAFLAPLGITPARADMLFAIAYGGLRWGEHCVILQSKIWRLLGVRPSVVCRMLKALEEAGWVTRFVFQGDRRQISVGLTPMGRNLLTRIEQRAFRFQFALCVSLSLRSNVQQLHTLFTRLRCTFRDRAQLVFPWCARIRWGRRNRRRRKFQRGVFWWSAATGITMTPIRFSPARPCSTARVASAPSSDPSS